MKDYKIINITQIVFCPELVLYKMVKFIKIKVCKELGGKISQRHTLIWNFSFVILQYSFDQPDYFFIFDFCSDFFKQNPMVYASQNNAEYLLSVHMLVQLSNSNLTLWILRVDEHRLRQLF